MNRNRFQNYKKGQYDLDVQFNETTYNSFIPSDTLILGIDIGTTSISAVVIDIENKTNIDTYTLDNAAGIKSSNPCFNEQNPRIIYDKVIKLVELIVTGYPGIKAIGVTGQMHGIVYINEKGDAVSPLITWQDKRADEMLENNESTEKLKFSSQKVTEDKDSQTIETYLTAEEGYAVRHML